MAEGHKEDYVNDVLFPEGGQSPPKTFQDAKARVQKIKEENSARAKLGRVAGRIKTSPVGRRLFSSEGAPPGKQSESIQSGNYYVAPQGGGNRDYKMKVKKKTSKRNRIRV